MWRIGGVRAPRSVQGDLRERVRVHQHGLRQARHRAHASGAQVTQLLCPEMEITKNKNPQARFFL